jgi:hypothetical protein
MRWRWSPLCHWPESIAKLLRAVSAYTVGGSCRSAFQSVVQQAVRVPESFRGGCSFGGRLADSLPLVPKTYPRGKDDCNQTRANTPFTPERSCPLNQKFS